MTPSTYEFSIYPKKSAYFLTAIITSVVLAVIVLSPMNLWRTIEEVFQLQNNSWAIYIFWVIYILFGLALLMGVMSSLSKLFDNRPILAGEDQALLIESGPFKRTMVPLEQIEAIEYIALTPEMTPPHRFKDKLLIHSKGKSFRLSPFLMEQPTEYVLQELTTYTGLTINRKSLG